MCRTNEVLFQTIGQVIIDRINDDWNTAEIKFDVIDEDTFRIECDYETVNDKSIRTFKGDFTIKDLLLELRQIMAEESSDVWRKAIVKLNSSGDFTIEFEY
jgi:hypothetical protein